MELTELIKDYVATELLSSIELDFLEGELWETTQHIAEINTVIKAIKNTKRLFNFSALIKYRGIN